MNTEQTAPPQNNLAFPLSEPSTPPSPARPAAHRKRALPFPRRQTAALSRHSRKCAVCHHKDRAEIELDFLHWHSAENIAWTKKLDAAAIYRHAHATGLFNERMRNIRYAAIHIAEGAESVKPTGAAVLQAIRACTLIDDEGKWNDPPKRIIVEHHHITEAKAKVEAELESELEPKVEPESAAQSEPKTANSNRNFQKLENAPTPAKQTTGPGSNRNFRSTKNPPSQPPPAPAANPSPGCDHPAP